MSTKCSILYREPSADEPGVHIYDEAGAWLGSSEPDIYFQIEGVLDVQFETLGAGRSSLTFRLPRKTAAALGLIAAPKTAPGQEAP